MKKVQFIALAFFLTGLISVCKLSAQNTNPQKSDDDCLSIMAIKKSFIEKNLTLSKEEYAVFWGIYNEYLKNESIIYDNSRAILKEYKVEKTKGKVNIEKLTDQQIVIYLENKINTKKALLDLDVKLFQDLKKTLSAKTLYQYYVVESRFKSEIKEEAKRACTYERR